MRLLVVSLVLASACSLYEGGSSITRHRGVDAANSGDDATCCTNPVDGGGYLPDAWPYGWDGGSVFPVDGGSGSGSGYPPPDAGFPQVDGGDYPPPDAGYPPVDAGYPPVDAGYEPDAGHHHRR